MLQNVLSAHIPDLLYFVPLILHKNMFALHTLKVTYFYALVESRPNLWHKAAKLGGKEQMFVHYAQGLDKHSGQLPDTSL